MDHLVDRALKLEGLKEGRGVCQLVSGRSEKWRGEMVFIRPRAVLLGLKTKRCEKFTAPIQVLSLTLLMLPAEGRGTKDRTSTHA